MLRRSALLAAALLFVAGCANPVPPGGGPRDETPPVILASRPESGAVNVSPETIELAFSEYVDQESLAQALSVTPAFDEPLEFDWSGRSVEIQFPEPLRENTTYLLTLSTDFQDAHGVSLQEPLTLAFSTGPTINRGQIAGRVVDGRTGAGLGGFDVYAYAAPDSTAPDSLPDRPAYRTQTGPQGQFQFDYLNEEQPYYVLALRDQNRNRQPDPLEAFAVPPQPALRADTSGAAEPSLRWLAAARDTLRPEMTRARALSQSRLVAFFSEPVRLAERNPDAWTLTDSLQGQQKAVRAVYQRPDRPQEVFLETETLRPAPHRLRAPSGAVADTSGNPLQAGTARFTPPAEADTAQTRFLHFVPQDALREEDGVFMLLPGARPGVQLSQPVDTTRLDALIAAQDTTGQPRPFALETANGTTYRLVFNPPLQPGAIVRITLDARRLALPADTLYTRTFQRISGQQLGELAGVVAAPDIAASVFVELHPAGGNALAAPRTTRAGTDGRFLFEQLPEAAYRFRAFVDRNGNGRWDAGQIVPYQPAEPVLWTTEPIESRPRWETVLPDTLRF